MFTEVVKLSMGKAFGELALINNKPRAATIKCVTDCHFAVISKIDYDLLLKRIEVKKEKRLVDFLESLPCFSNQSRIALVKLKFLLQPKDYIRGQEVVKEDDPTDKVFIIKTGEFSVLKSTDRFPVDKKALKDEKEKLTLQKVLDIQRKRKRQMSLNIPEFGPFKNGSASTRIQTPGSSLNCLVNNDFCGTKVRKTKPAIVALLGPGEIFGEYEACNEKQVH